MSKELRNRLTAAERAWHDGVHAALDAGLDPDERFYSATGPASGRVIGHCHEAMAAVLVQHGTAGGDEYPTVEARMLLRWGAFKAEVLATPNGDEEGMDENGELVIRIGARETMSGELDLLAAALRQAADLIDGAEGRSYAEVSVLPGRSPAAVRLLQARRTLARASHRGRRLPT